VSGCGIDKKTLEGALRNKRYRVVHRATSGAVLGFVAVLACACSGAIHKEANVGGADTLSLDARQRMLVVGERVTKDKYGRYARKPVRCDEPSPDALVAVQETLSASGGVSNIGSASATGSAALAARTAESAASIGYRDSSIQMLRDAYYRLCEAYMNGVLSDREYGHMVENADTYLAVASALQIVGPNPVAPAVAISGGGGTTTAPGSTGTGSIEIKPETTGQGLPGQNPAPSDSNKAGTTPEVDAAKKAAITRDIVHNYLVYRDILRRETEAEWRRDLRARKSQGPE
jgi:hypothetical protein